MARRASAIVRVRVRLFGGLADRAGAPEDTLELPEGATAGDVLRAIEDRHRDVAAVRMQVAVNLEVVPADHPVHDRDEVALLPPVAGGETAMLVGLREQPSVEEALDAVAHPDAGGTVAFVGTVRGERGRVERLVYSSYVEMAERILRDVAEETTRKWALRGVAILHGVGHLAVGERTVVVACSAEHRDEAFDACRYAIDEVKRRAPIWKKEVGPDGERWVGLE
jgi:molybdopterin converting factor subunit 1